MEDLKKIQEFFSKPINEVGEASAQPYEYKLNAETYYKVVYTFITDSGLDYIVKFELDNDVADVVFLTEQSLDISRQPGSKNVFLQTFNKGELFKVMATITNIVKEFLEKYTDIKTLVISPTKEDDTDNRRAKLYSAFIKKSIDSEKYSFEENGKEMIITRKLVNENQNDPIDSIKMDVPLFLRSLEYAKEDAKDDMDLHDFTEKAIKGTKQKGTLSMVDYDDLTRQKIKEIIQQAISEKKTKRDRCLRIADRKFDKPSAYKSGAVVRCRKGDIWKNLKEEILSNLTKIEPYNDPDDEYAQDLDSYLEDDNIDWRKESYITLLNPNNIEPSEWNYLSDDPNNSKSIKISKADPKSIPPILVVKKGENKYEVINGIHRTYAFRLNNNMIPAIVMSPTLEQGLSTNDQQMENFMFNKYKNSNVPTPTKINNLKEEQISPQEIISKIKTYRIPYKEFNQKMKTDWIPMWKEEYGNDIAHINELVARHLLYQISEDLFGGVEEIEFANKSKNPTNHFQMNMYLGDVILWTSPFIYVDNNHKVIAKQSEIKVLNNDYDDIGVLKEDESLNKWFKRSGTPGKEGGWVDCNAPIRKDGKITGYKSCGRKEGEKRSKYPSCRPTAAKCKDKGKGKTWGKTK
jgi:ParB-like chromosome segregation protein Spo0J